MSISPQSLARTRDKRSLRVPARYDDFSSSDYAYRNVAEALKLKGKSSSRARNSSTHTSPEAEAQTSGSSKRIFTPSASSQEPQPKKSTGSKSRNSTPAPPLEQSTEQANEQTNELVNELVNETADETANETTNEHGTEQATKKANEQAKDQPKPADDVKEVTLVDLECREMCAAMDLDIEKVSDPPETPLENLGYLQDQTNDQAYKKKSTTIKISSVHPSITISNGPIEMSSKKTGSTGSDTKSDSPVISTNQSSKSPNKKRSKGYSLMVKPGSNAPLQSNIVNRSNIQQSKCFNNQNSNMQYGTRLLLNEPIYLPRSVAPIAPITTTLAKIANQARKRPFITEKVESWISYLEDRKIAASLEFHFSMIKIINHLTVRDILNLRLVNKSWKSIVDSDAAWKIVKLEDSKIRQWETFFDIMTKYETRELLFVNYSADNISTYALARRIYYVNCIERVDIKTSNPCQNLYFLELLSFLHELMKGSGRKLIVTWKIKVYVDERGLALVPIQKYEAPHWDNDKSVPMWEERQPTIPICYELHPEWNVQDLPHLVEISEISDLFHSDPNMTEMHAQIEPI